MRLAVVMCLAGCSFHPGSAQQGDGGCAGNDGAPGDVARPDAGDATSCTSHLLPPSVNVDATAWSAQFLTAPIWTCNAPGTTTIDSATGMIASDSCQLGTPQVTSGVAQAGGGASVMVVRLRGLTVSGGHTLRLTGDKPIVLLVAGDVVVDTGGLIDASASGATPGPGGSMAGQCVDRATGLGLAGTGSGWGGGGGGFGSAGGQGCYNTSNGGLPNGDPSLMPLRGGCSGGATPGSTAVGAGGGALEIAASGTISVGATGAANIVASGGGAPAVTPGGGNGGGSGGGILLVASAMPSFGAAGAARANGGAGSQGCGTACTTNAAGGDGHKLDDTQATDSSGIAGGGDNMDHGRQGGLAYIVGSAALVTLPGDMTTAQTGGRGGGGGGGGRIALAAAAPTQACD